MTKHAIRLVLLLCALWALPTLAGSVRVLVQSSPLAGSQYYALSHLVDQMRVGDALTLIREPDNRFDARAIRVEWQGHKLGYVPRAENSAVAAVIDRGERVSARIARLRPLAEPWLRLEIEIFIEA